MAAEVKLTSENFKTEVLESKLPVLVDFWAVWCGPCRMLAPTIAELAEELDGQVIVGKVNVDEEPDLAQEYGISSIPTVLLFREGKMVGRSVGYVPKESLMMMFENA